MKFIILVAVMCLIISDLTLPMVHASSCKSNCAKNACDWFCHRSGCNDATCTKYRCRCNSCYTPSHCPPSFPGLPRPPGC